MCVKVAQFKYLVTIVMSRLYREAILNNFSIIDIINNKLNMFRNESKIICNCYNLQINHNECDSNLCNTPVYIFSFFFC